jgi:hypothetical protein
MGKHESCNERAGQDTKEAYNNGKTRIEMKPAWRLVLFRHFH